MSEHIVNFSDLYRDMEPELPNCPPALMLNAVRMTLRDFCDHTAAWQYDHAPITIRQNITDYDLDDLPTNSELIANGSVYNAYERVGAGETQNHMEPTRHFIIVNDRIFRLLRKPDYNQRRSVLVRLALRPCESAISIEDDNFEKMFSDYRDGIAAGAKHRLMRMPKKDWTDPAAAEMYRREYYTAKSRARAKVMTDGMREDIYAKPSTPWLRTYRTGKSHSVASS